MKLADVIAHVREHAYMSQIERDALRVRATAEVFTPTTRVQEALDCFPPSAFIDEPFLDNSCGDGQFLSEVLIRKMEHDLTFEQALSTIYGVELMEDNVELCRNRLLCGQEQYRHIVENNIVCADALRYHYRFDGSPPYDPELPDLTGKKKKLKGLAVPGMFE